MLWTSWENTHDNRVPVPTDPHFDAAQYDAELARASADVSWEQPVDTSARLLVRELADRAGPVRSTGTVSCSPSRRSPYA